MSQLPYSVGIDTGTSLPTAGCAPSGAPVDWISPVEVNPAGDPPQQTGRLVLEVPA